MFGLVLTVSYTLMLAYLLWRAASTPVLAGFSRTSIWGLGAVLWGCFMEMRLLRHQDLGTLGEAVDYLGMNLLGAGLLFTVAMFVVELVTVFGFFLRRWSARLRGGALVVGAVLTVVALVQGQRDPVVESHEVMLPGLPRELDGTVLLAVSDAHIGSPGDAQRFSRTIEKLSSLRPDLLVFLGDMFDGYEPSSFEVPALSLIEARLGKWFVLGNHEARSGEGTWGSGGNVLRVSGFELLRDSRVKVAPGLILAGVQDLTMHRRRDVPGDPIAQALTGRPEGATVLLSHTPWQAEHAAEAGVGLMLSGHTHNGQLWPFGYLVRLVYPLLTGRYQVGGMTAIVSRGAGTWGPTMRLWPRGDILLITLRAPKSSCAISLLPLSGYSIAPSRSRRE